MVGYVERLESYVLYDTKNGGEALLRLAIHHLRNPGQDAASAEWTAHKIEAALQAFYSGEMPAEKAFKMRRGDCRTAGRERGYDPALRVPWPVSVCFHVEQQIQRGRATASNKARDSAFDAAAAELNHHTRPRGKVWTAEKVKRTYYTSRTTTAAAVQTLRRRLRFSQI